jgi:hypothetical protein
VELDAQKDGLLRTREIYSSTFNVQRLMLAQLVNLKSRMNAYSDGRVYVARNLKLALPATLQPGSVINFSTDAEYVPKRVGDAPMHFSWKCEAKDRYDASKIFPTLTGKVVPLACESTGSVAGQTPRHSSKTSASFSIWRRSRLLLDLILPYSRALKSSAIASDVQCYRHESINRNLQEKPW